SKFYCYTNESRDDVTDNNALASVILSCAMKHFQIKKRGKVGGSKIKNGIIQATHDGSFEDFMNHNGTNICITTETPVKQPIEKRIQFIIECVNEIVNYFKCAKQI
ncbi:MAG: hypothetical protein Q7K43_00895, partial [Candidatus Woesearchaeota archaeon]|nr:hypothetical protein [Candidatus Woesearchaeota archaeon]